jgi:lysophospholipase L1-like esterase
VKSRPSAAMVAAVEDGAGAAVPGARRRAVRVSVAMIAGSVIVAAGVLAVPSWALSASTRSRPGGAPAASPARVTYYLAVGASESVGYQPQAGRRHGAPTTQGYANDLLARERSRWPGLRLVQVGCPGETAVAAVDGGGPCAYPAGSQLATAVQFLRSHRPATVLVTMDLGFNDIEHCLRARSTGPLCVAGGLAGVRRVLPRAVAQLRAAGGPAMHMVGLEHADPFVARFLAGRRGRASAAVSLTVLQQLNDTLRHLYRATGVAVADVPRFYGTADQGLTRLAGHGAVPLGVARDCRYTWECDRPPYAPNLHPNARGYRAIAGAIAAAVGTGVGGPAGDVR